MDMICTLEPEDHDHAAMPERAIPRPKDPCDAQVQSLDFQAHRALMILGIGFVVVGLSCVMIHRDWTWVPTRVWCHASVSRRDNILFSFRAKSDFRIAFWA